MDIQLVLLVITGFLLLFVAGTRTRGVLAADKTPTNVAITVGRGDTVWSVAQKYGDPNEYILARIDRLARANRLERGAVLSVGQTLIVPATGESAKLCCKQIED